MGGRQPEESAGFAGLPRLAQQAQQGLDRLWPGHGDPPVGQHEGQGRQLQPGRLALVGLDRGGVLVPGEDRRDPVLVQPGLRRRPAAARAGRPAPCPRRSARRTCARPPPPAAPGRPRPRPGASAGARRTCGPVRRSRPAGPAPPARPRAWRPPRSPRRLAGALGSPRHARTSGSGRARHAGARTPWIGAFQPSLAQVAPGAGQVAPDLHGQRASGAADGLHACGTHACSLTPTGTTRAPSPGEEGSGTSRAGGPEVATVRGDRR